MVKAQESGYIALLAVLIVGAAATAIALVLLASGADSQRSALVQQQSKQARALSMACAEESLQVIHDNIAFAGTSALAIGQGTCSYTVTVASSTSRTIVVSGTVGNVIKKIQATVTINASTISVAAWQEIS